jgi:hypothetical protein
MYWFLVWSFVAVFSYNYDAADANVWVTPDEIDRRDLITDDGMYHLIHFAFHRGLTGSSYVRLNFTINTMSVSLVPEARIHKKPLSIFITYGCIDFTSSEFQLNS